MFFHPKPAIFLIPALTLLSAIHLLANDGFYHDTPAAPSIPDQRFLVTDFGGVGDGKTMNTEAFAAAIAACKKAGGGSVVVPAGVFVTGPIKMVSKMALVVEKDGVIQASDRLADFGQPDPLPDSQKEYDALKVKPDCLIRASKLTDIAITGEGKIDGRGLVWWARAPKAPAWVLEGAARLEAKLASPASANPEFEVPDKPAIIINRPNMIVFYDCERIHLGGLTFVNPPKFHFVPGRCKEILVEDLKVLAPHDSPNTDGIDPSNCRNVLIRRCLIDTGDDNIAIKSGKSGGISENITVTDCILKEGHGISIGSETDAGVRNFLVRDCEFEGSDNGLRIKSDRTRGGIIENVAYRNIRMKDVDRPIKIFLFYDDKTEALDPKPEEVISTTPIVRNVTYTDVVCHGAGKLAGEIMGLPESPITDVTFENVTITGAGAPIQMHNTRGIKIINLSVSTISEP